MNSTLLKKYETIDQSKVSEKDKKVMEQVKKLTNSFEETDEAKNKVAEKILDQIATLNPDAVKKPKVVAQKVVKAKKVAKAKAPATTSTAKGSGNNIMSVAKEIQKAGESWKDAMERAKQVLKERREQVVEKKKTEMDKLLALVRTKKELQGFSKSDIQRDAVRTAKVKGVRFVTKEGNTSNAYGTFPNKLGRKYWETRDRHSDRLAPNYPKDMPLLASGGVLPKDVLREIYEAQEKSLKGGFFPEYKSEMNYNLLFFGDKFAIQAERRNSREFPPHYYIYDADYKYLGSAETIKPTSKIDYTKLTKADFAGTKFVGYKYADGGGVGKMPEWSVSITSEDGDTYDWDGFAKNEDEALYKAEQEAGFESVESGITEITDAEGNKIEYANGGGIDGGMNNLTIQDVSFANGGSTEKYKVGQKFYDTRYDRVSEIVPSEYDGVVTWKRYNKSGTEFENDSEHILVENQFDYLVNMGAYQISKQQMAKGGNVTNEDKLLKELYRLQRELNSGRLSTYREGDNSEEEMARQKEREVKLARFNEVLKTLRESDAKFANGGSLPFMTDPNFGNFQNTGSFELGGAFMTTDLAGHTGGGTGGLNADMPLSGVSGTYYTGLVGETGAISSGELFARGGAVGDNVLGLKKGDIYKIIDTFHTSSYDTTMSVFTFIDYEDKFNEIVLKSIPFPPNPKKKNDFVYVSQVSSDGIKVLNDEEIGQVISRTYKNFVQNNYEAGGAMMQNQEVINDASQHYVNYYLEQGASQGFYKDGGSIPNNYEGKDYSDLWDKYWNEDQKYHFLTDHKNEIGFDEDMYGESSLKRATKKNKTSQGNDSGFQIINAQKLMNNKSSELPMYVKFSLKKHIREGQYAYGGKTKSAKSMKDLYIGQIASLTGTRTVGIEKFVDDNNLTDSELSNLMTGLGRGMVKRSDFVTALSGQKGNAMQKEVIAFAKSDKAYKMADGGFMNNVYAKGGKIKVGDDDFTFLLDLSDKELQKRLDLVNMQKSLNAKQYFDAKDKKESTAKIEEAGVRLDNQWYAIVEARNRKNKNYADGGFMNNVYADGGAINGMLNKKIKTLAEKKGITMDDLGRDEYNKVMTQALVESLTDANFHDEAKQVVLKAERKTKWSDDLYRAESFNPDEKVASFAREVARICEWDGDDIINAYFFVTKMAGSKVATMIEDLFLNKKSTKSGFSATVEFNVGDIVWDKGNKDYGTVMNNYGDSINGESGEIRLDSDGNQTIFTYDKNYKNTGYNLIKLGENGDTGKFTPDIIADMKANANRLIDSRKQSKDKEGVVYYQEIYKRLLNGEFDSMAKGTVKPKKYIDNADIKSVTVNYKGKEVSFKGEDVLNGANLMEKGGDLSKIAFYIAKRDVISVELKNGETIKPMNGYWVKKGAEPISTPSGSPKGKIDESKAHFQADPLGNVFVDSNFVNQSQGNLPNTELKHYGYGDFYLQTPDGNIDFIRTDEEKEGFVGRTHKMKGSDELVLKLVNAMKEKGRFESTQTFANGGAMQGNNIDAELEDFDIDELDDFESMQYKDFIKHSTKAEALQILINNVDGDYSQLSPALAELAEMQMSSEEYDEAGRQMRFERDGYANGGSFSDYMNNPEYKKMVENYRKLELDVKRKVIMVVGIDSAIEFYDADYPLRPYQLLEKAVRSGFITVDEIDERVIDSAMETAEDSEGVDEIGSSDFTAYLHDFLDEAGFKVGYVGSKLTREFADGGMFDDNDGFMRADNENNYRYPETDIEVDVLDEPIDLTDNTSNMSNEVVIMPINEDINLNEDGRIRARMGSNPMNRNPNKMMAVNQRMVITDFPMTQSNKHKND
jgi:hypothetical protein